MRPCIRTELEKMKKKKSSENENFRYIYAFMTSKVLIMPITSRKDIITDVEISKAGVLGYE